jgi:hypothetical protein
LSLPIDSDRIRSENTAARNGFGLAKTAAREGPTRLMPPNQSRFATTRGPTTAKAYRSQIDAPKP